MADETEIWNKDVRGDQVRPLINDDARVIRVEAGPGTGKTFGLKRRVLRLIKQDSLGVSPEKILVIAFNRVIAQDLRNDIEAELSKVGYTGRRPRISTIHGLCLEILGGTTRLLLDHERDAMIYDVRTSDEQVAADYKDFDATSKALLNHEAGHETHVHLWQCCESWLLQHKAELVGDLPASLLDRIKGGDFPDPRFTHIIVDEFQDLTPAEQQLTVQLLESDGSFVALGDPRQSIYHFRGNDREGLSKLETLFGATPKDVPMSECQRCPGQIVDAANTLMSRSRATPMTPGSAAPPNTHVVTWDKPEAEAEGMAKAIVDCYKAHPDDKHLVMVTRRRFGYMLRDQIERLDSSIVVDLNFQEGPLESWAGREAFLFFCLMADPDAATWRAWLGYQDSVDGKNYKAPERNSAAYLKLFSENGDHLDEAILAAHHASPKKQGEGKGSTQLRARIKRFLDLKAKLSLDLTDPTQFIEEVFHPDLWVTAKYTDNPSEAKSDVEVLRQAAIYTLSEVESPTKTPEVQLTEVAKGLRIQISTRDLNAGAISGIKVTTIWSAKGVTADHVYVIGLCNEAIPGHKRPSDLRTDQDFHDEQRRLFYVTITRTKGTLVLSRAVKIDTKLAMGLGFNVNPKRSVNDLAMSSLLRDITGHLPAAISGATWGGIP